MQRQLQRRERGGRGDEIVGEGGIALDLAPSASGASRSDTTRHHAMTSAVNTTSGVGPESLYPSGTSQSPPPWIS